VSEPHQPILAVIVSYNTRELTIDAIASVLAQPETPQIVVVDNASADGSARAILALWPDLILIEPGRNLGFGRAVNLAVAHRPSRWILLLNPDAALQKNALARLVACAEANPGHAIYGGRTHFHDGRLNPYCCQNRITPWSALCFALGLSRAFPTSALFNSERIGGWQCDSLREVDIIYGTFCLIDRDVWDRLGGFDPRYWLYGEDVDLCLRAIKLTGTRPLFTPDAIACHIGGAAQDSTALHLALVAKGRATVMRQHWPPYWRWMARPIGLVWVGTRLLAELGRRLWARLRGNAAVKPGPWHALWAHRGHWLNGYRREGSSGLDQSGLQLQALFRDPVR
jgi:GT2 family glycosyltransferase